MATFSIWKKKKESASDFETELYQEHLEEASFLYEQRLTLFDDIEITWLDIEDFEERFEAHIDALVVRPISFDMFSGNLIFYAVFSVFCQR